MLAPSVIGLVVVRVASPSSSPPSLPKQIPSSASSKLLFAIRSTISSSGSGSGSSGGPGSTGPRGWDRGTGSSGPGSGDPGVGQDAADPADPGWSVSRGLCRAGRRCRRGPGAPGAAGAVGAVTGGFLQTRFFLPRRASAPNAAVVLRPPRRTRRQRCFLRLPRKSVAPAKRALAAAGETAEESSLPVPSGSWPRPKLVAGTRATPKTRARQTTITRRLGRRTDPLSVLAALENPGVRAETPWRIAESGGLLKPSRPMS